MVDSTAAAQAALDEVAVDPVAARRMAETVLVSEGADAAAVSIAERALGLAFRQLRDPARSAHHLERSVSVADRAGLRTLAALAGMSLSANLAEAGRFREAIDRADQAIAELDGPQLARALVQKATINVLRGRRAEAVVGYSAALPELRRAGDLLGEAVVLANRGVVHLHWGELRLAERDQLKALAIFDRLGERRRSCDARLVLGRVAALSGDLPRALRYFDEADEMLAEIGVVDPLGLLQRTETLLAARLIEEARSAVGAARRALVDEGLEARLIRAHLLSADVCLAEADYAGAAEHAATARRFALALGRPDAGALATYAGLRVQVARSGSAAGMEASARQTSEDLAAAGLKFEAADARAMAGRAAAARGDVAAARADLDTVAWARRRGPPWLQMAVWHTEAEVRLAAGTRSGARRALRAGLRRCDRHQATLGAADLRARAAEWGAKLAAAGLRLALEDGTPSSILDWAERLRANGLDLRPTRPPENQELAEALGELRAFTVEAAPTNPGRAKQRRLEVLESRVTSLLRRSGAPQQASVGSPSLSGLRKELAGAVLIEYVESDGELHALTIAERESRLASLGGAAAVAEVVDQARFAAARLARSGGSSAGVAAATGLFDGAVRRLDAILVGRLASGLGGRAALVAPTGSLHLVPWSALPSLAFRSLTVTPSAGLWLHAQPSSGAERIVLAAGPGLAHAAGEVEAIAPWYPDATILTGAGATPDALLEAMDGAGLVHVAAHGRVRLDNPLFGSLELHGGRVYLCDIERLDRPPEVVILSACEAALSGTFAGDELMGLAAAFLGLGTRTVVASTLPVSDRHTRPVMVRFHQRLAAGARPAAALADARVAAGESVEARLAAASFTCFGRG